MWKLHSTKCFFALLVILFIVYLILGRGVFAGGGGNAQSLGIRGKIVGVETVQCSENYEESETTCYELHVRLREGEQVGETVAINIDSSSHTGSLSYYQVGQEVFVDQYEVMGEDSYTIVGIVREDAILLLLILFVIAVVIIGGWQGIGSLIGLLVTFVVLFGFAIPMLLEGNNPIIIGFIGAVIVLAFSIYLSHGFNAKTTTALISTLLGMGIVCILAIVFIGLASLSGMGNEDTFFLLNQVTTDLDMRGILFVSIIIGGIGIIDDVTINQVSTMQEIARANPELTQKELFKRAMNVGRDHVSSMVNTLFIAYAAASMPLVMMFQLNGVSLAEIINNEIFVEDIVRTIVGSIGLVLVVPITTWVASYFITKDTVGKWLGQSKSN